MTAGIRKLSVVVAVVVAILTGSVAFAAIPDSGGVIHGCYRTNNPNKGSVIVVDSENGESCPQGTVPLNWNQQGPPGPAGAVGYEYRTTFSGPFTGQSQGAWRGCSPGKRVVGGGGGVVDQYDAEPLRTDIVIHSSTPTDWNGDGTLDVWRVNVYRIGDNLDPYYIRVWVICVS